MAHQVIIPELLAARDGVNVLLCTQVARHLAQLGNDPAALICSAHRFDLLGRAPRVFQQTVRQAVTLGISKRQIKAHRIRALACCF